MSTDAMFKPFAAKAQRVPNRTVRRGTIAESRARRLAAPCRAQPLKPYRRPPAYQPGRPVAWTAATVRMRGLSSPPPSGDTLTSGQGPIDGATWTGYGFKPRLEDTYVYRTTLVAQGEDLIDLQTEVAIPASPTVTTWTVSGADVGYFDLANGQLVLKAATRASISKPAALALTVKGANANGESRTVNLIVRIPADADCRFVSFQSGSNANNGQTPATAWKHAPGSTPYTGSTVTLGANKVLFFKAERHNYTIGAGSTGNISLDHEGTSGNPMVYEMNGWGGRATVGGDDPITGWTTVTQAEVGGNPNYANIRKISMSAGSNGGAIGPAVHIFSGEEMCYPAQSPTPADLWDFEKPEDVTEQGGMWRATVTTSTGTTPRMSQSGTTITIVDPRVSAVFGSNDPTGLWAPVWVQGNRISRATIASYNQGTNTITLTLASGSIPTAGSTGAYSFTHHPCQIVEAGQFAMSVDGLTVYAWLPNAGATSVSRRDRGMSLSSSYVIMNGGNWERFASPSGNGGWAMVHGGSGDMINTAIRGMRIRQCRVDSGDGLIYGTGSGTWTNCNIERNAFLDHNPHASGIRCGNSLFGYVNGTPTQVRNNAWGKIRWNYCAPAAIQQTFILSARGNGMHITGNCARDLSTVHGNCISLYSDAATAFNGYNVIEDNLFDNCVRGYTVSIGAPELATTPRYNVITRNIFLGNGTGFVVAMYSGEPSSTFSQNIVMGATGWDYAAALSIGDGVGVTCTNNVASGFSWGATLANCSYTVTGNLLMVNAVPPNDGGTRVSNSNTVVSGAPIKVWDRVMTSAMASALGPGDIGLFYSIAA